MHLLHGGQLNRAARRVCFLAATLLLSGTADRVHCRGRVQPRWLVHLARRSGSAIPACTLFIAGPAQIRLQMRCQRS